MSTSAQTSTPAHLHQRYHWAEVRLAFMELHAFARADFQWWLFASSLACLATLLSVALIWQFGIPFDLLQRKAYTDLGAALAVLAVLLVARIGAQFSLDLLAEWLGLRFVTRLRNGLLRRIMDLSYPFVDRHGRGDLLARLSNDVAVAEDFLVELPLAMLTNGLRVILFAGLLFWVDAQLAFWVTPFVPLYWFHQRLFVAPRRRLAQGFYTQLGKVFAFEEDCISNLRSVSTLGAEARMAAAHRRELHAFRRCGLENSRCTARSVEIIKPTGL